MGIVTATLASAISTGTAISPAPAIIPDHQPEVHRLISTSMPLDRLIIRLTVQEFGITPKLDAVIHSAILRSFEHQYHL